MSSKRNPNADSTWQTPDLILDRVRAIAPISLDPCTTPDNPTSAITIRTPEMDPCGLKEQWNKFGGLWFVNPPYQSDWYNKIGREIKTMSPDQECVALIMAKPSAHYFRALAEECDALCFVSGRLTFKGAPAPAGFGSALLYFGWRPHLFARAFQDIGWCVE